MLTRYYNLFWAILLEAGFASMWQDDYPRKNHYHREAYIESAAIMQAHRDIHGERYHQCANSSRQSD